VGSIKLKTSIKGFTVVEVLISIAVFGIVVIAISSAYSGIRRSYQLSRQLNEIYTVLSACPEIDRALEFSSLTTGTNCYPNNTFASEGGTGTVITYTPSLTVTDTYNLSVSDPLSTVPDSKVIDVSTGYSIDNGAADMKLRLLVARNGVAQQ
jgi:prepilin-type N-terminal cleavage/methylation domain-containing protein